MSFIQVLNTETVIANTSANLTDWLNLICVATASGVAIYGINSWQRETRWKKRNELQEEVTILLYELKDVLRDIRSPFAMKGEGDEFKAGNDTKYENLAVFRDRYKRNQELFAKLQAKKYHSMTLFGKSIEKYFVEVNKFVTEIFIANRRLDTQFYPKLGHEPMHGEVFDKFLAGLEEAESIVFWQGDDDAFEKRINKFIDDFITVINKQ